MKTKTSKRIRPETNCGKKIKTDKELKYQIITNKTSKNITNPKLNLVKQLKLVKILNWETKLINRKLSEY